MPFAALLHLSVGVWMVSNPNIIPLDNAMQSAASEIASGGALPLARMFKFLNAVDGSNIGASQRLQSNHVLPMLFAWAAVLTLLIVSRLVSVSRGYRCRSVSDPSHQWNAVRHFLPAVELDRRCAEESVSQAPRALCTSTSRPKLL